MSAPGPSRQPQHTSSPNNQGYYEAELIGKLQRTISHLNEENESLRRHNAQLHMQKVNQGNESAAAREAVKFRDGRIDNLVQEVSKLSTKLERAETTAQSNETKYMKAVEELNRLKAAYETQSTELAQTKQLNLNLRAHIEKTPAPRKNLPPLLPPASGSSGHLRTGDALTGPHQSFNQMQSFSGPQTTSGTVDPRQSFVGQGSSKRPLPAFAKAAVSKPVTIRDPSEVIGQVQNLSLNKDSALVLTAENQAVVNAVNEVFAEVEKFAKQWTIFAPQSHPGARLESPPSVRGFWSNFDNPSTISEIWSSSDFRHWLIVRSILLGLIHSMWSVSNLYSISDSPAPIRRLMELQKSLNDGRTSNTQKHQLMAERARIFASFSKNEAIRQKWTRSTASEQARKMHEHLKDTLSPGPIAAQELEAVYNRAGRLAFTLWSLPCDWRWDFLTGGKSVFWDPSLHEPRHSSVQKLSPSQIKLMGPRVLFCATPSLIQISHSTEAGQVSCVRRMGVLLSRDGVRANLP